MTSEATHTQHIHTPHIHTPHTDTRHTDTRVRLHLDAEDAKLVVLARSARLRAYTPGGTPAEGAAVRDTDGRTYAAATVGHSRPELALSALRGAVAAAASSGVRSFEAAAVVTDLAAVAADDLAVLAEFGTNVPVFLAGPDGVAHARTTS